MYGAVPPSYPLHRGHLAMSGEIFGCQSWRDVTGIWGGEARDAAIHPTMHRTVTPLPQKNYPTQNVSAEIETLHAWAIPRAHGLLTERET